ncbi:bifunctional 3'-5' exonuclease/DNA polymerase, partial [Rhodococcus gannanensis]
MRIVLAPGPDGVVAVATDDVGTPTAPPQSFPDAPAAVRALEPQESESRHPRWVWPDTAAVYPDVLRAGLRVQRCHDLALTGALLAARSGRRAAAPPAPPP